MGACRQLTIQRRATRRFHYAFWPRFWACLTHIPRPSRIGLWLPTRLSCGTHLHQYLRTHFWTPVRESQRIGMPENLGFIFGFGISRSSSIAEFAITTINCGETGSTRRRPITRFSCMEEATMTGHNSTRRPARMQPAGFCNGNRTKNMIGP